MIPNVYNAYTLYAPDPINNAYDINGTGSTIVGGFDLVQFGNSNGKWETNTSTNIGFDAVLLKNSLELVFDWYNTVSYTHLDEKWIDLVTISPDRPFNKLEITIWNPGSKPVCAKALKLYAEKF